LSFFFPCRLSTFDSGFFLKAILSSLISDSLWRVKSMKDCYLVRTDAISIDDFTPSHITNPVLNNDILVKITSLFYLLSKNQFYSFISTIVTTIFGVYTHSLTNQSYSREIWIHSIWKLELVSQKHLIFGTKEGRFFYQNRISRNQKQNKGSLNHREWIEIIWAIFGVKLLEIIILEYETWQYMHVIKLKSCDLRFSTVFWSSSSQNHKNLKSISPTYYENILRQFSFTKNTNLNCKPIKTAQDTFVQKCC